MNFLTITQSLPTGLDKNYNIQLSQVRNDYLKNITSPNVNSVYFYQANSIQNQQGSITFDLLPLHKLQSTFQLDYNNNSVQNNLKYFKMFDLSKSPSYMQIVSQNDIRISSSQITDLATTFANYLQVNPTLKTALNTNYTIKQSQTTHLAPVDMSNYLPLNPTTQITLSSKYTITASQIFNNTITVSQIANHTLTNWQIAAYTITNSEIAANTILLQKLFPELVTLILQHRIYVRYIMDTGRILQIDETGSVCQFAQQLTFSGGSQIGTAYCYTGFGSYMYTTNSNINSVNQQQPPSPMIQLDITKILNDGGSYGMHFTNTYYNQSIFMGFCGQQPWIIGGGYSCCFFALNTNPSYYLANISNDGTYFRNSDQNKKQNVQKKTNYQDQLNKILKLDIVTYSYDLNYTERIQELQQFLQDENLTDEKRKEIQKDIFKYKFSNLKHNKVSPIKTSKNVDLIMFQIIIR